MPNSACAPPGCVAESGHDFVEDQRRPAASRDLADLAQELDRLQRGVAALHRLDEHGGQLVRVRADVLERLGRAVVEHGHVRDLLVRDARGDRQRVRRAALADPLDEDFVERAVVGAGEQHDPVPRR